MKILAAVAAPDETKTASAPLDVEAEMQAVLDAVGEVAGHRGRRCGSWRWRRWRRSARRWRKDAYHVLHLSAHGSAQSVELEDEDGNPVTVTADDLMAALRQAGRPLPLIVLSSCSGGSAAAQAMAAGLAGGARTGSSRCSPRSPTATPPYWPAACTRSWPPGPAPGRRSRSGRHWPAPGTWPRRTGHAAAGDRLPLPEYGVATLLAAGGDGPLVDPAARAGAAGGR